MRIALINPTARRIQGYHTIGSKIPQGGLQVLAALTPAEHTVEIIDEVFGCERTEELLAAGGYDLVGLTAFTCGAPRAYEIAGAVRKLGVPVVMGGPHAWACPDEAGRYVDSVAVGEADAIWPAILDDAAAGRLQPRYEGGRPELTGRLGRADQQIQPINGRYDVAILQTSRGCPIGCDYCSVTLFNGPRIRRREIGQILDEWNRTARKFIFVSDDNFFGLNAAQAEWSKELCRAIIKHGRRRIWFSQTSINMGDDPEGLRLAYRAGCRGMLIGFESFNPDNLADMHKAINRRNAQRYDELIDGFHRGGLSVFGCFIIGADHDTPDTVAETAYQSVRIGCDTIQITNLTPLPGTKMYDRWLAEGRIHATNYPEDWEKYTFTETVYHPARMTADELDRAIYELRWAAANRRWVWPRTLRALWRTRSLTSAGFIHGMNRGWQRMARIQAPADAARFGFVPNGSPRMRKIDDAFALRV